LGNHESSLHVFLLDEGRQMDSETLLIVLITVAVCAVIGVGAWIAYNRMRSQRLRQQFGAEYDRTVRRAEDRDVAEAELESRRERVSGYQIVALSEEDRTHYQRAWEATQTRFVDDPRGAAIEADEIILTVMEKRGYPIKGFEQAAADLSVDYPTVVENYRAASAIAQRNRQGRASTEDLRQALVLYRALFHELLQPSAANTRTAASRSGERQANRRLKRGGFRA
jgi:FtsZ-interacting cell division protein ZipA